MTTTTIARLGGGWLSVLLVLGTAPLAPAQPPAALSAKAADAATLMATADREGYVRVIVEFAAPVPAADIKADAAALASIKAQIAAVADAIVATHFGSAANPSPGRGFPRGLRRFDITPGFAVNVDKTELSVLAADPRVVRIHPDRLLSPLIVQSVPLIGMLGGAGAYALGATGSGQVVAIVDTGVQSKHELLDGKVVSQACFSNGGATGTSLCPNGTATQTTGPAAETDPAVNPACFDTANITNLCAHGTHVAGIAAGKNVNFGPGEPATGVAKDATIVAVQVFTRFDAPALCTPFAAPCLRAFSDDIISALEWLVQTMSLAPINGKLAAVNMSLGGPLTPACDTDLMATPIDALKTAGVATVIASGNNSSTNSVSFPGCISIAVTVGSSTKLDKISSFSNMAPMVDLMAPGSGIVSSVPPPTASGYAFQDGTSMATPHVTGAFAAIRSKVNTAGVDQIVNGLKDTGVPIADNRPGGTETKPRICLNCAINLLGGFTPPPLPAQRFRFQYAAKFVCGANTRFFGFFGGPSTLVESGDYKTVVNVHNPSTDKVAFRHKVAVAGLGQDGAISLFSGKTIGPDAAHAFDCELFQTVDLGSGLGLFLLGIVDGFFVIESDSPLDVIAYYTADRGGLAIDVERVHERDTSRSSLCRRNLQVDLAVASNWLRSDGNPAVSVSPLLGTPPSVGWDYNRPWIAYYPKSFGGPPPVTYAYELAFCSCSLGNVTVDGTFKADDSATASLNALPVGTAPGFSPGTPAGTLAGAVVSVGTGSLVVTVTNGPGPTGLSVMGALSLADGHLGACRN